MGRRLGTLLPTVLLAAAVAACAPPAVSDPAPAVSGPHATAAPDPAPNTTAAPSPDLPTPSSAPPVRAPVVVGLGDSVPAGSQCHCTSYVALVGQELARDAGVPRATVRNLAAGGETTAGLIEQLSSDQVARQVASADLVLVMIGANDFDSSDLPLTRCASGEQCLPGPRAALRAHLDEVLGRIGRLAAPGAKVLVTGYWNVFVDGAVGRAQGTTYMRASDVLTRAVNGVIAAAARRADDLYVDLYGPFKGGNGSSDPTGLLAGDGDHPNAAGHRLIARQVLAALTAR